MTLQSDAQNRSAARAGRDAGMMLASDHAEASEPGWSDRAFEMVKAYVAVVPHGFTTLELRKWAAERGFVGETNWAWGSIIVRAVRQGVIKQVGSVNIGDATSHQKLSPKWQAAQQSA